ncbi:MAG TPA: fatty acid desaturase [Gemmatimonadaceae bacterium]
MNQDTLAERRVGNDPSAKANWRRVVETYTGPNTRRASFQLATTLLPLALIMWGIGATMSSAPWLAIVLVFPAAGLLVRTFIVMHDCAHGSFFASRWLNDTTGAITGIITLTPFVQWRRDHALHHASSGDLDRRGHGDVPTLTVREYLARSPGGRRRYRILRHPLTILFGGPIHLALGQRLRGKSLATRSPQTVSVWMTNTAVVAALAVAITLAGWRAVLFAYALPYYVAAMSGVWLFYVQHQFEDAYWAPHDHWDYLDAALRGSTHLQLPRILQWFTGSIGLHHVHHVAPRIPNYRLQSCHDENVLFQQSPVVTLRSGLAALRLSLWDEAQGRMVGFRDLA